MVEDAVKPETRRTVLITGASGGFRIEYAKQLEPMGYNLILHGRDAARLQLTLDSLKHRERHRIILADLNVRDGISTLLAGIAGDEIYGLVNNAGFGIWGSFEQTGIVPQIDVIKTDLKAPVALTHALLPGLRARHGFIINVSSLAGESPLPYMSTYAAAKAGLSYWSEALRTELAGQVRVVTLAPGPSPTGFRDVSGMPMGPGNFFRTPSELVVRASLRTLQKGGGYCVPGWRHRLLYLLQRITPRSLALKLMANNLRP
ncbi:MAG: SDR family NAD(P)-dependent oxidoreductase [Mariprofundaceae bacterium]